MSFDFQPPAHAALDPAPLAYERADDDVARLLGAHIGSHEVFRAMTGHTPPRGYYRVHQATGDLFVKVVRHEALRRLASADAIARRLAAQGLPVLPLLRDPIPVEGGFAALSYRWIDGRFSTGDIAELEAVGHALGRLHTVLRAAPPVEPADAQHMFGEWRRSLESLAARDDLSAPVSAAVAGMLSGWTRVPALLLRGSQPIHNDFHRGNVLFTDTGRVAAILDFEDSVGASASPVVDLATAIERFCLVGTEPEQGRIRSWGLIASYRTSAPAIPEFTWDEIATVAVLRSLHALGLLAEGPPAVHAGWSSEWRKFEWLIRSWSDWGSPSADRRA